MKSLKLVLPWPPSVNSYKSFNRAGTMYHGKGTKAFREEVAKLLMARRVCKFGKARLKVGIYLWPPDNRKRDIDNLSKVPLDTLELNGIFNDDSQIDELLIVRREIIKNGRCEITIHEALK